MSIHLSFFVRQGIGSLCRVVRQPLRQWSKPSNHALVLNAAMDLARSKSQLVIENMLLRQQLIVLKRQVKRPRLIWRDRALFVLVVGKLRTWKDAVVIVQPNTVLRWHSDLVRWVWECKRMAEEDRSSGTECIRGELLKLGVEVSKRTIQRYMPKVRRNSSQTWATFLKNHAGDIWACDFTVVHDLLSRPRYIFVVIELQARRIVHTAVTRSSTDDWTAQQLREATLWGKGPNYLIRDRDNKYAPLFLNVAKTTGIKVMKTPVRAPKANATCERFIGSLKRKCLDQMLILHSGQLHHIVRAYVDYYNHSRPHQGIGQRMPARFPRTYPP